MEPRERIIVDLMGSNADLVTAFDLANKLSPCIGLFIVGSETIYSKMAALFSSSGYSLYYLLKGIWGVKKAIGQKVFLDVRLNNPDSIEGESRDISRLNPAIFTIDPSIGPRAVKMAVANKGNSMVFGTGVFLEEEECQYVFGVPPDCQTLRYAELLVGADADGILCLPEQGVMLRSHGFNKLLIACPIDGQNQEGQMTPYDAIMSGIDMLIIGKSITEPLQQFENPVKAVRIIELAITLGLKGRKEARNVL